MAQMKGGKSPMLEQRTNAQRASVPHTPAAQVRRDTLAGRQLTCTPTRLQSCSPRQRRFCHLEQQLMGPCQTQDKLRRRAASGKEQVCHLRRNPAEPGRKMRIMPS